MCGRQRPCAALLADTGRRGSEVGGEVTASALGQQRLSGAAGGEGWRRCGGGLESCWSWKGKAMIFLSLLHQMNGMLAFKRCILYPPSAVLLPADGVGFGVG